MSTTPEQRQRILEAALMIAGHPLSLADMQKLFDESEEFTTKQIREVLQALMERYADSGIELREVASGFQFQARTELSPWLSRLWEERAPRLSRALLETLALIAYRQPITRAEIEEIRGVVVSSNIIKTLQDREWIRVVGYKDVPGKPALFATTRTFLDHLSLKNLNELPPLSEIIDLEKQEEKLQVQLELQSESNEELIETPQDAATTSEGSDETFTETDTEDSSEDSEEVNREYDETEFADHDELSTEDTSAK